MSIGSIGGTPSLNQLYAAQAAQPAVSLDLPATSTSGAASTTGAASANALTGSTTASLDSQTLQALMDLAQQDPASSSDPAQAGATGQSGQTQGIASPPPSSSRRRRNAGPVN